MVATAYVLISVEAGKAREVYDELSKIDGVQHLDAVSGPYDIVATIQGADSNAIGIIVLDRIQAIKGITDTITLNVLKFENCF